MRSSTLVSILVLAAMPLVGVGCGTAAKVKNRATGIFKRGEGEKIGDPESIAPAQVMGGTIKMVRTSLGFVLIEKSGPPPPSGSELSAMRRGKGEPVAKLKVSPESKTGFVVADILSGDPKIGDVVMWSRPTTGAALDLPLPPPSVDPIGPLSDLPTLDPSEFRNGFPADDTSGFREVPSTVDPRSVRPMTGGGATLDPEAEIEREIRAGVGPDPYF